MARSIVSGCHTFAKMSGMLDLSRDEGGGAGDVAGNGGNGVVIIRYRVRRKGFILNFY